MPDHPGPRPVSRHAWVTWALVLAIILLLAATFTIARAKGAAFGGSDAAAVTALEEQGVEPWFEPLVQLGGGEIESGLFAAQAAFGGVALGWAIGRLQSRSRIRLLTQHLDAAQADGSGGQPDAPEAG